MAKQEAPADIAKRCEASFRSGGSAVQVFAADGQRVASPSTSAASALRLAYAGETVYARRKVEPRRYGWVVVGVGK